MDILKSFKKLPNLKVVDTKKSLVLEDPVQIKKVLEIQEVFSSARPDQNVDRWTNEGVLSQAYFPYDDNQVYELYLYSAELRLAIGTVNREVLRPGFDIIPKIENPSEDQKKMIEDFIGRSNGNNQALQEVFLQLGKDVDIFDDFFGVLSKDYYVDEKSGDIIGGEVQEFFRINPIFVDFLFSKDNKLGYDYNGQKIYFDIQDRSIKTYDKRNKKTNIQNAEAHFRVRSGSVYKYYNMSEIIHQSLHEPSLTRGHSPLRPLYNKTMSLIGMDYTIEKYYDRNERQPGQLLFVNTTNFDTILKWWKQLRQKVQRNPTAIHPIPVNNAEGKQMVQHVDLRKALNEMQYTQVRDEIRRTISAFYGVSNIFTNDVSASGGLYNEGLQIKVTNRAVEVRQRMWNEKVLPWIFGQMGVTDYDVVLKSSKEEDQAFEVDLEAKKIANAEKLVAMGLKVRYEDGEFIMGDGNLEKSDQPALPVFQGKVKKEKSSELLKVLSFGSTYKPKVSVAEMVGKQTRSKVPVNDNVPKSLQDQFFDNLQKELKILTAGVVGKKLTKALLNKLGKQATEKLEKKLKTSASNQMDAIYEKSAKKESKTLGDKFEMSEDDKKTLSDLKKNKAYNESFKNLSKETTNRFKEKIQTSFDKGDVDPDKLAKELRDEAEVSKSQLDTIVRTETTKVSEAARMTQYEKKGIDNFLFEHVGPSDNRTTSMSKGVKSATKGGVSWEEYLSAIESNKVSSDWVVDKNSPITHPNTRHIFVAKPRGE